MPKPGSTPIHDGKHIADTVSTPPTIQKGPWGKDDEGYNRIVAIAYPRKSYYVFDVLTPVGWARSTHKEQITEERALSAAQSVANSTGCPVRIVEKVDT